MTRTYTHHSRPEIQFRFDPSRTYDQSVGRKPSGLWLSVDEDWQRWCTAEGMDSWLGDVFGVDVDEPRLKVITTADELDAFHDDYGVPWKEYALEGQAAPDWPRLATEHAGIVIAPCIRSRHLGGSVGRWYYGWDCASACVWDLSAIRVRQDVAA